MGDPVPQGRPRGALTCCGDSCYGKTKRRGWTPPLRPAHLPDPIVALSRVLATALTAYPPQPGSASPLAPTQCGRWASPWVLWHGWDSRLSPPERWPHSYPSFSIPILELGKSADKSKDGNKGIE